MHIPEHLRYTQEHEWIRVEGTIGWIGITDHAQTELGDIVYVDIPANLERLVQGKVFGTIEAVKTVADLYAPCSGTVLEINPKIASTPEIINRDCYGEGWIIKIEVENPAELDALMSAAAYREFIGAPAS
ncbi:MAG: glycine cleavage system protein GcvH [Bacteroidota bacterium]|nr:glycine cleavage system protein GcvH [Candidatus Kapabacteria bacterium]MCS7301931.1 glycine cleavage system protein GcvH [Candidatus Kapabacteria bacterium]MCX7936613.1 glycine cleavage system protein GcvH [Chlorobiota bacterium]MDW8271445.1 glycine cleavage system protein GcvH [Bacteroidota bacterium]